MLKSKDSRVRRGAAEAVGKLGTALTPKLLGALTSLLADKDCGVRRVAIESAGKLGVAATPKLLDALEGLLADKDEQVRHGCHRCDKWAPHGCDAEAAGRARGLIGG